MNPPSMLELDCSFPYLFLLLVQIQLHSYYGMDHYIQQEEKK